MYSLSKCCLITISLTLTQLGMAAQESYWQCNAQDQNRKLWSVKNSYKRVAQAMALEICKKESPTPMSCEKATPSCIGFNQLEKLSPQWKCMALDFQASSWEGDYFDGRDAAYLGAKAFCRKYSPLPDSCYVNVITCVSNKAPLL